MKFEIVKIDLSNRKDALKVVRSLIRGDRHYLEVIARTPAGREYTESCSRERTALARDVHAHADEPPVARDEPIPFELLQAVAKEVWDLDLPDNYGFEHVLKPSSYSA